MFRIGSLKFNHSINNNNVGSILPNSNQCSQCPATIDAGGSVSITINTPIWLKSGEVVSVVQGSGVLISAIEFNIVQ